MSRTRIGFDELQKLERNNIQGVECSKSGYRLLIPLNQIDQDTILPLIDSDGKPYLDWNNKPLKGKGIVFLNPKDGCIQAMPIDGTTCLVFPLGATEEEARPKYEKIITQIKKQLPNGIHTGADAIAAATIGGCITKDAYNSDETWRLKYTNTVAEGDGFVFAEGKGPKTNVLWFSGFVEVETGVTGTAQIYRDGCFLIRDKDAKYHACSPDMFKVLYKMDVGGKLAPMNDAFIQQIMHDSQPALKCLSNVDTATDTTNTHHDNLSHVDAVDSTTLLSHDNIDTSGNSSGFWGKWCCCFGNNDE